MPTYPSPKPTLTLTSHLGQNDGLGVGQLGSFPETLIDPALGGYIPVHYFSRLPPILMCGWVSPLPSMQDLPLISLCRRWNQALVMSIGKTVLKSRLVLSLCLCTRLWVRTMISMLKKPLSICKSGWKENWNAMVSSRTRILTLLCRHY